MFYAVLSKVSQWIFHLLRWPNFRQWSPLCLCCNYNLKAPLGNTGSFWLLRIFVSLNSKFISKTFFMKTWLIITVNYTQNLIWSSCEIKARKNSGLNRIWSSVSGALHWYQSSHGFESSSGLNVFRASISQLININMYNCSDNQSCLQMFHCSSNVWSFIYPFQNVIIQFFFSDFSLQHLKWDFANKFHQPHNLWICCITVLGSHIPARVAL